MTVRFVVYEPETGRIRWSGLCQPELADAQGRQMGLASMAHSLAAAPAPESFYVLDGEIVGRPALDLQVSKVSVAADGVDTVEVRQLPVPCAIRLDGQTHLIEAGWVDLTFSYPGTYTLEIDEMPFAPLKLEIVAS